MRVRATLYSWFLLTVLGCLTVSLAHADTAQVQAIQGSDGSVIAMIRTNPACVGLNPDSGDYWNCMIQQANRGGSVQAPQILPVPEQGAQQPIVQQRGAAPGVIGQVEQQLVQQQRRGASRVVAVSIADQAQQAVQQARGRGLVVREVVAATGTYQAGLDSPVDPRAMLEVYVVGSPQHETCVRTISDSVFRAAGVDPGWSETYGNLFCEIPAVFHQCMLNTMTRVRWSREAQGHPYFAMAMAANRCNTGMILMENVISRARHEPFWHYTYARPVPRAR